MGLRGSSSNQKLIQPNTLIDDESYNFNNSSKWIKENLLLPNLAPNQYRDALAVLKKAFEQPHAVAETHLDKLNRLYYRKTSPGKMHWIPPE